tara:strand:+ start:17846 stop:19078 length:1233 start_codon:yes stop_codon:yes gene_type:complete
MRLPYLVFASFLCLIFQSGQAFAQKIPPHLSSMTSGLVNQLKGRIENSDDAVLKNTGRILKDERVHQWSKKPATIKGGAKKLAESIGLDISKSQDWIAVKKLLEKADVSQRHAQMKTILQERGLKADENTILESLANFDIAQDALLKDIETEHRYKISKHEKAVMQWDPQKRRYDMRITGSRDKEGKEPQQTILRGDIDFQPSKDGDDLEMIVKPAGKAIQTLDAEDIKKRENNILGKWTDGTDIWLIELRKSDEKLQSGSDLPIDKNNPLRINDMADEGARPLNITVIRGEDDSEYSYRNAYLSGLTIKADRTLTDRRDIQSLPQSVIDQLIASWSPPEWIEFEIAHGLSPNDTVLEGALWRLHVTYKSGIAGPGPITKIATPYKERGINLTRDIEIKTADGADKREAL